VFEMGTGVSLPL